MKVITKTKKIFLPIRNLLIISYIILFALIIVPPAPQTDSAQATTGIATPSTLTFTSTNAIASVDLSVNSFNGTFATSPENKKATFKISTNNYTGYTVKLSRATSDNTLHDIHSNASIASISSPTSYTDFSNTGNTGKALNNKWGYIPNYFNSMPNTDNYYPAPVEVTLMTTDSANGSTNHPDTEDVYTIGLGVRADYTNPSSTYISDNLVIQYVANDVAYSISFDNDTGDSTVANLPSTLAGDTSTTGVVLTNDKIPTRTGYTFANKWCLGTTSSNGTTCSGTVYNVGDTFGIDQTMNNTATLYAMWTPNTYNLSITFADIGISSVKVCTTAGDCTGTNLKGTVSSSGNSVSGLSYGISYYLYPIFISGFEFANWAKTDSSTNATLNSTSTANTYYTMGIGNGAVTLTSKRGAMNCAPSGTTIATIACMQDISNTNKASVLNSMTTDTTYTLYDSRDETEYHIAKLADGKIWMLDNLALDLTDSSVQTNLTSLTTNASNTSLGYLKNGGGSGQYASSAVANETTGFGSYTIPQINNTYKDTTVTSYGNNNGKVGIYYNYCAASAGSYCYDDTSGTGDALEDICPVGWHLPTAVFGGATSDFADLINAYNDTNAAATAFSVVSSGYIWSEGGSTPEELNEAGTWWSSSFSSVIEMHSPGSDDSKFNTSIFYTSERVDGNSIRCLFNPL